MQASPAEQRRDEQAVWFQRPAALYHLPDRIAGPMERQRVNDQIMRAFVKIQHRIVRHDPRAVQAILPDLRKSRHHGGRRKGFVNLAQPFLDLIGDVLMQEQFRPLPDGAAAAGGKGGAVGKVRWSGSHDRGP